MEEFHYVWHRVHMARAKKSPRRYRPLNLIAGRRLGKYRLEKRLGAGGSCEVWRARDTVEDILVALKIPLVGVNGQRDNHQLFREIRLVSQLCHPSILNIKNADVIEDHVVLATEISGGTLDDRYRPMAPKRLLSLMTQVLQGLAHAHSKHVVHCDVSPMNIFLFDDGRAALGDFGISQRIKGRMVTIDEFGTPGYVAPEQAYGRPTFSSDCFAAGLIMYEFLTGVLPRWPFRWPLRGHDRLRDKTSLSFVSFMKRALSVDPAYRFVNAGEMLSALHEVIPMRLRNGHTAKTNGSHHRHWTHIRRDAYVRRYAKILPTNQLCVDCGEPIHESMQCCAWCGSSRNRFQCTTHLTHFCDRCTRGLLPEWSYCPWCFGAGYDPIQDTPSLGVRYHSTCTDCHGKIMRFMRYCPWCRSKIKTTWRPPSLPHSCSHCQSAVDKDYWHYCPWCTKSLY